MEAGMNDDSTARTRFTRACLAGALAASLPFVLVLTNVWSASPLRTAHPAGYFSGFYDIQARALLDGRLDVPEGSLNIEAFVFDGRHYMYFPPLPSLFRMPILAVTDRFDGRLTGISIAIAWVVTTTLIGLLMWRVRTVMRGPAPVTRIEQWGAGMFLLAASGGSILVFLPALPWVYHEAYAWAVATVLGSLFSLIGLIERPTWTRAVITGAWTLAAVLTRTTGGWACAIALLMTAVWFALGRRSPEAKRMWWAPVLAAVVPLLVGGAVNWAKFRHPWMFPLDRQVWTELSEQRRRALELNGGSLVGSQFFTSSLVNYFRPDGIRFASLFPYVSLPADPARGYNGAFLDQTYRTGSVSAFMPLMFGMSLWGLWTTFKRNSIGNTAWLRIPVIGALGVTAGVMFYGYIAHRYTAEFFVVLVLAGAIGLFDVTRRLETARPSIRRIAGASLGAVALFGVYANTAVAVHAERVSARGESLREYVIAQNRVSEVTGDPIHDRINLVDEVPDSAPADELFIVGECDAMYLATGERGEMWSVVEAREGRAEITVLPHDDELPPFGRLDLFEFVDEVETSTLSIVRQAEGVYRLVLTGDGRAIRSPFFYAPPDTRIDVNVLADTELDRFLIIGPKLWGLPVTMSRWTDDWFNRPTLLRPLEWSAEDAADVGLEANAVETPTPALCDELRSEVLDL